MRDLERRLGKKGNNEDANEMGWIAGEFTIHHEFVSMI